MDESELDELLQRAIDPYVPVELFYAVLDRIGRPIASHADPQPHTQALALPAAYAPSHLLTPESEPEACESQSYEPQSFEPEPVEPEQDAAPLPDATVLMEQVEQLEAAMAGD
jgi:hypothetical protein